jgi:hypothetical protein
MRKFGSPSVISKKGIMKKMKKQIFTGLLLLILISCAKAETPEQKLAVALSMTQEQLYPKQSVRDKESEKEILRRQELQEVRQKYLKQKYEPLRQEVAKFTEYVPIEYIQLAELLVPTDDIFGSVAWLASSGYYKNGYNLAPVLEPRTFISVPYNKSIHFDKITPIFDGQDLCGYSSGAVVSGDRYLVGNGKIDRVSHTGLKADFYEGLGAGYKLIESGEYTWSEDGKGFHWNGAYYIYSWYFSQLGNEKYR